MTDPTSVRDVHRAREIRHIRDTRDAAENARLWAAVMDRAPRDGRGVIQAHLTAPVTPASDLAATHGVTLSEVRAAYRFCRDEPAVADLVDSPFYPHRLRHRFAAATVADWVADPTRPARLRRGAAVVSRTVEIHPTRGSCNYKCTMCLWSDQDLLTYRSRRLDSDGLIPTSRWCAILDDLRGDGATRLVISGGGEALLNPDLPAIIAHARRLGFEIDVYTAGFAARPGTAVFDALLGVTRVRFSIHSPDPATYDLISGTDPRKHSLDRVHTNIASLLRARGGCGARVGIGFVTQPSNHTQLVDMVAFAEHLRVDWLDLRKDECDVTDALTPPQRAYVGEQLRTVRGDRRSSVDVDFGDELVAIANDATPATGEPTRPARSPQCRARYFRPVISPYGHLSPCDLKAEPRFADTALNLGSVRTLPVVSVLRGAADRHIPDACEQCMPSSRTGNLILHKFLTDLDAGVSVTDQPFVIRG